MKLSFLFGIGLVLSLGAFSSNQFSPPEEASAPKDLRSFMEEKFQLRDRFTEKGNTLKYLKVHH